jgi:AcrR family transcriptional regulator
VEIQDLCEKTGVSKQSIYRYIRMGLLPKSLRSGFKKSEYNENHLRVLKRICRLRAEKKMSFSKIKDLLKTELPEENGVEVDSEVKKDQIIDAAIALLSKNGFANTKVSDVTDALGVAKGTFYLYFKSKRDLFLECIDKLTLIIIPEEIWKDVRKERDFMKRQQIKLHAFLKAFPRFSGILNLLRFSLQSDDPVIAGKARSTYNSLGKHLVKDMTRAIEKKEIREVNVEILALLLHGMAESLGYIPLMDPRYTYELGEEVLLEFMRNGLLLSETENTVTRGEYWNVEDSKGVVVEIREILFGGSSYLSGMFGEGEIRVDMKNMRKICIENGAATITSRNAEQIRLTIDESLLLSGHTAFGGYSAPLSKIASIYLVLPGEKNSETLRAAGGEHFTPLAGGGR